jgi:hypothetical protein
MIFKMFCNHNWTTLSSISAPKISIDLLKGFKGSESLFEKLYYGSTKIIFSCKKCGKLIEKEYVGEVNA